MSFRDRDNGNNGHGSHAEKKEIISRLDWERRLDEVMVSNTDLNKLILNYLIIEGYKDAAEQFCMETGLHPGVDLRSIEDRIMITKAIQEGRIEDAIERVNDLDPEILDTNPQLYFHLQQQRLIEYIRVGDIPRVLEFAQEELAPRGEENPKFLEELERTLSLLAFDPNGDCPVKDLLDMNQRQKTAAEMNEAILLSQSQEKDPKLPLLLKNLAWSQGALDERALYPRIVHFASATWSVPPECDVQDYGIQY